MHSGDTRNTALLTNAGIQSGQRHSVLQFQVANKYEQIVFGDTFGDIETLRFSTMHEFTQNNCIPISSNFEQFIFGDTFGDIGNTALLTSARIHSEQRHSVF